MLNNSKMEEYELRYIGLSKSVSAEEITKFLYENGRHAVAHASRRPTNDPDDWQQVSHPGEACERRQLPSATLNFRPAELKSWTL
jgi:hypothetical protein